MPNKQNRLGSPRLLISAGAQAAAQGLIRSALLTKLLPFAAAGALVVRLFGKGSTETRPAAGNPRVPEGSLKPHRSHVGATPKPHRSHAEAAPGKHPTRLMRTHLNHGGYSHE
jgi:hypothetical protein